MTLTEEQYKWVREILNDCTTVYTHKLSDWEQQFVLDMDERVTKYEDKVSISEKQMQVLQRIERKIYQ